MESPGTLTPGRSAPPRFGGIFSIGRLVGLCAALIAGLIFFLRTVHQHYPIQHWLFWTYLEIWGWCAVFSVACLSAGHLIVAKVLPSVPLRERIALALPVGCLGYFLAMFSGGLLRLYGPVFAIALPLVMVAPGALHLLRTIRRVWRHMRAVEPRPRARPWWWLPALAFGLCGLGLVYFSILSPRNAAFDSHFYHLGLAQEYAVEGAILRSAVGWQPAMIPHLASILYTWCFLLPGLGVAERILCAAHLEFTIFLWTLLGVPVLVRWLVPRARAGLSWVVMFLFPGILLYDSSLTIAADHIAALWAVPAFLALRRAYRDMAVRECAILAAILSGAILTKYQGIYIFAFPALVVTGRALWLAGMRWHGREGPRASLRPFQGLAALGAIGVVLTAPHWLKNWIWYGDPLSPMLWRVFGDAGWAPEGPRLVNDWFAEQARDWSPQGTFTERLAETIRATFMFSFEPHDWPKFHGQVPVFGSLFTLSLLALPFVRGARRTWTLVAATQLGIFIWYWTLHQDRYLQAILPWMAVVTASAIALVWRAHVVARPILASLVLVQAVWGGDVYFIPAHAMTRRSPAITSSELLAQGYKKNYHERLEPSDALSQIGRDLPQDARVLTHEENRRLGLWRPVVADIAGWNMGLRYELLDGPGMVHDELARHGVDHIVSRPKTSRRLESLGGDLRFFDYLHNFARHVKSYGTFDLYRVADERPREQRNDLVAYLGCGRVYERGIHRLETLSVRESMHRGGPRIAALKPAPDDVAELTELLREADYLVSDKKCKPALGGGAVGFKEIAQRKSERLYVRTGSAKGELR